MVRAGATRFGGRRARMIAGDGFIREPSEEDGAEPKERRDSD
jgi:hypothetical protein